MYENKLTGFKLSDEEYKDLILRESIAIWNEMNLEEKEEFNYYFDDFFDYMFENDNDFIYVEGDDVE